MQILQTDYPPPHFTISKAFQPRMRPIQPFPQWALRGIFPEVKRLVRET